MIKETYAVDKNGVYTFTITNANGETATQTITVTNVVESTVIPISTVEQLGKIGTGEIVQIVGVSYDFEETSLYELKNDIEFTGDYSAIANRMKANNIRMTGGDNKIIVTKADGKTEYYTEDSKYYIAVNKYGYVLDGLVMYYDGIDNTGTGVHDRTATVWKDLSGNGNDGTISLNGATQKGIEVKEAYGATWIKMFHHKSNGGTTLFKSENEALNYNTADKYSILGNLEAYRNNNQEFEFLLEYPELTGYNRWKQISNATTTEESVTGYTELSVSWSENRWGGLCKSNSTYTLIDGSINHTNWFYGLGAYSVYNQGMPGPSTSVNEVYLWVRIDNLEKSGWLENGLKFDGLNDSVLIEQMNYDNFTLETVVEFDLLIKDMGEMIIMGNYHEGGYGFTLYKNLNFYTYNDNKYVSLNINQEVVKQNKKYSVSGRYDGTSMRYRENNYYNIKNNVTNIGYPSNNTIMALGGNPKKNYTNNGYLSGVIYIARIYNRPLEDDEVRTNYLADKKRFDI